MSRAPLRMTDVCLFSPSTPGRLRAALPRIASTWGGSISIAVVADVVGDPTRTASELEGLVSTLEGDVARVSIAVVEKLEEFGDDDHEPRFPVNFLRNIAREKCSELGATWVLAHDVDFECFAPNASAFLNDVSSVLRPGQRHALVVPAFELHARWSAKMNAKRDAIRNNRKRHTATLPAVTDVGTSDGNAVPAAFFESLVERDRDRVIEREMRTPLNLTFPYSDRERLRKLVDERRLSAGFQVRYFPRAHAPSNYNQWFSNVTCEPYRVAAHKHPWYYEPYVILRADMALPFDESFVTYGFNKVQYAHELAAAGFVFYVTKNAHTVHTNVHLTRAMANLRGKDLEKCLTHPAGSKDYRIARIGHSCIPAFFRRMQCAYGFTLSSLDFSLADDDGPVPQDLLFRLQSDENIVCYAGCVTDLEESTRTPGIATFRGGRWTNVTPRSDARRRKRGHCERFDGHIT